MRYGVPDETGKAPLFAITAPIDRAPSPASLRKTGLPLSPDEPVLLPAILDKQPDSPTTHRPSSLAWTPEILAILVGLTGLGGIAAVLSSMDDKALADWSFPIQPNSLVSVFSTASTAGFTTAVAECIGQSKWVHFQKGDRAMHLHHFDQASRGALGSLQLLLRLGFRDTIAIIGSLVTIASLAMDPFTQQIIQYPTRAVQQGSGPGFASIIKAGGATTLERDVVHANEVNFSQYEGVVQLYGLSLVEPVYLGLLGQSPGQTYTCSTGNCSYPAINTLGICSTCEDVTKESIFSNCSQSITPDSGGAYAETCNLTTPGNVTLSVTQDSTYQFEWLVSNATLASYQSGIGGFQFDNGSFSPDIVNFAMYTWNGSSSPDPGSFAPGIAVQECSIYFCERDYTSFQVIDGIANAWTMTERALTVHAAEEGDDGAFYELVSEGGNSYLLGALDQQAFSGVIYDALVVSMQGQDMFSAPSLIGNILWTNGINNNITQLFNSFDEAMTTYLRLANSTVVAGEAYRQEVYVKVRWQWFGFPAGLATVATVFQVATILVNRSKNVEVWKSSALPLIVRGVDTLAEMEKIAAQIGLRVERTEIGQQEVVFFTHETSSR